MKKKKSKLVLQGEKKKKIDTWTDRQTNKQLKTYVRFIVDFVMYFHETHFVDASFCMYINI